MDLVASANERGNLDAFVDVDDQVIDLNNNVISDPELRVA